MPFILKQDYIRVLQALVNGEAKASDLICVECGFKSPFDCTGAISILRRADAIDQAGHSRYRITEKGKAMLAEAGQSKIVFSPRVRQ